MALLDIEGLSVDFRTQNGSFRAVDDLTVRPGTL